jgi:hypothetical protein
MRGTCSDYAHAINANGSSDSTFTAGITLRTAGNQTYSGAATSTGTITIQAGSGSTVGFLGNVSLGGLVTATDDTSAYDVVLTGSTVSIGTAVTYANTGSVTLGDDATDDLHFTGGVTSSLPATTTLAGTIRTTNANATFGGTSPASVVVLSRNATVSTGTGDASFAGTVNGTTAGGQALVVNATGTTAFAAAVGGSQALASIETDAGGTTALNGGSVKTSGTQTYADAAVLGA